MKRLNPLTNIPFKQGDIREDGYVFWGYKIKKKSNGFFQEQWCSPDSLIRRRKHYQNWQKSNYENNKETQLKWHKKYAENNRQIYNAKNAKRRSAKIQRVPSWLTKEHAEHIKDLYVIAKMFQMYTGQEYHVDHIVPLQGKNVSGFHAPWNLQVIPAKENLSKGNKHGV